MSHDPNGEFPKNSHARGPQEERVNYRSILTQRSELIRVLENVLTAYDHRLDGTNQSAARVDAANVAEARNLLALVLPPKKEETP